MAAPSRKSPIPTGYVVPLEVIQGALVASPWGLERAKQRPFTANSLSMACKTRARKVGQVSISDLASSGEVEFK
jgi:hypothetical protein